MTVDDIFKEQIKGAKAIPQEVYDKMEYKRSTFNNLYEVGDKVLYAYMVEDKEDPTSIKLLHFSEKELENFRGKSYIGVNELDGLPVFEKWEI